MTNPVGSDEVPNIEQDYDEILEWTIEEEEAFLAILSAASNDKEDM